jgi:phosphohistidine phosphatase
MKVIMFRHAQAEPRAPGTADADRQLVKKGHQQARSSARGIEAMGEKVERVLTSGLVRARQTGEQAAEIWGVAQVEDLPALGTDFDAPAVDKVLCKLIEDGVGCVCLVGHAPTLGDYAARLIGVKAKLSETVDLTKGGAACVEVAQPGRPLAGVLKWLLHRDHLAQLAEKG